jgi:hypothetical protein
MICRNMSAPPVDVSAGRFLLLMPKRVLLEGVGQHIWQTF